MTRLFFINLCSIFFLLINLVFSQLNYKASVEGGILNRNPGDGIGTPSFYGNFDGMINYLYRYDNKDASFQIRIRPEFYDQFESSSLKMRASGGYLQCGETSDWGLSFSYQKLFFDRNNYEIDYSIFSLILKMAYFFNREFSADINFGYGYQTRAGTGQDDYDLVFTDVYFYNNFNSYIKGGLGIYAERFWNVEMVRELLTVTEFDNRGLKIGPQLSFSYLSDNIIQFQYRMNLIGSTITDFPSTENWIRIVAGKLLSEKWSILGMMDYLFRSIKINKQYTDKKELIIGPENLENRIYLKMIFEPADNFEFYLKAGYFNENFMTSSLNYEGLSIVLGIEVNND